MWYFDRIILSLSYYTNKGGSNTKGNGGDEGDRPLDLNAASVALSQLSYVPSFVKCGVPKGSRTPVLAVKGRCPRPLDDGDLHKTKVF